MERAATAPCPPLESPCAPRPKLSPFGCDVSRARTLGKDLVDLTSSIAFTVQRARSDLVRVEEGDVVPIGKIASDSLWHRVDAYVGVTLRCRRCSADFSFAASEQKAWRED